MINLMI